MMDCRNGRRTASHVMHSGQQPGSSALKHICNRCTGKARAGCACSHQQGWPPEWRAGVLKCLTHAKAYTLL